MKQLRIHCFQHVAFEGLGYIEIWANQNKHLLTYTKFYDLYQLPDLIDFDWLIIMGGPMGVQDKDQYSWLPMEKEFIRNAIGADKTVIGICLGSQLIASAMGATVYPNITKEIGWFPVTKTREAQKHGLLSGLPDQFVAFHWHGDTFDLPKGSVHLFQTESCPHQAFLYKNNVLGLQFHLEATLQALIAMTQNCPHELIPGNFIQTEQEILRKAAIRENSNKYLASILCNLAG